MNCCIFQHWPDVTPIITQHNMYITITGYYYHKKVSALVANGFSSNLVIANNWLFKELLKNSLWHVPNLAYPVTKASKRRNISIIENLLCLQTDNHYQIPRSLSMMKSRSGLSVELAIELAEWNWHCFGKISSRFVKTDKAMSTDLQTSLA